MIKSVFRGVALGLIGEILFLFCFVITGLSVGKVPHARYAAAVSNLYGNSVLALCFGVWILIAGMVLTFYLIKDKGGH